MKRWYGVLVGLVLLLPTAGWAAEISCTNEGTSTGDRSAQAFDIRPSAKMLVGDELVDLSECITEVGKFFRLDAHFVTASAEGDVNALYNTDPFISFGVTTLNLIPGATTFAFLFGTPIVPGFYSSATSTGGVTVTAGVGPSTVDNSAIYPFYISGYGTVGAVPTNLGVDLGTLPCSATTTTTCDQGEALSSFGPTFYDNLEALLTYTQSGTASVASWSGKVEIFPAAVPEPASLALVAMGVLLVGARGLVRRRRN